MIHGYYFVRCSDTKQLAILANYKHVSTKMMNFDTYEVLRFYMSLLKELKQAGVNTEILQILNKDHFNVIEDLKDSNDQLTTVCCMLF